MKKLRNIGLLASILVFILSSWYMLENPLWGYVPLFNYLSILLIVLRLCHRKLSSDSRRIRWLRLALSSGALLSVGFPPSPLFAGMLVGMVPMLMLEKEIGEDHVRPRTGLLFGYLFFGFWLWNVLSTFWVANTAYIAGMIANVANAMLMTLPWLVFHRLTFRQKWAGRYILLAGFWILFEYLHSNWDISWPWLTLGNGMATAYPLVQWYEFTGYFGGSVWIWAVNILLWLAVSRPGMRRKWAIAASLVFIVPVLLSLVLYFTYREKGEAVDVTVVQPNYEPHYQKFTVPEEIQVEKMYNMTAEKIDSATRLIIFPETVVDPVNMDRVYAVNPGIYKLYSLLYLAPEASILLGIGGYHTFTDPPSRSTVRNSNGIYYELYNAAFMLENDSNKIQEYHKSRFVPGAELFPFKKVLPFLKPLVKKLGGTYEGFAPQDSPTNFRFGNKWVAPVICYESVYGGWVAKYVKKGAGLLAIITNDGWWDNTPGHMQHLAIGRLRAIENRKDIARSANTGTSCFINQRGDIRMATDYETDAVIRDKVYYSEARTFYSMHGDYIVVLAGIMTVVALFYSFLNRKEKRMAV